MAQGSNGTQGGNTCNECDMPQLARNHYFTGKLLVERDFTDEQRYQMGKQLRHNRYLHGSGTVCGLKVKQHTNQACQSQYVVIEPGAAIDCCGHEILITHEEYFDFKAKIAAKNVNMGNDTHTLQICLRYDECPTEQIPVLFDDCSSDDTFSQPNRITESYSFDVRIEPKTRRRVLENVDLDWLYTQRITNASRIAVDEANHRLYVLTTDDTSTLSVYNTSTIPYSTMSDQFQKLNVPATDIALSRDGTRVYVALNMLDCVYQALLPPCAPAPAENCLVLACLTVKNDKVVETCDFCHRRYAGSFPSLYYWLSLVPVIPLLAYAVQYICCYDWLTLRPSGRLLEGQEAIYGGNLQNRLSLLLDRIDSKGHLRQAIFANKFALPKRYAAQFKHIIDNLAPDKLTTQLHPDAFNLATIVGTPVKEATTALSAAGVTPIAHEVASANEVPILNHLMTPPFAKAGDQIVVYHTADTVVGYALHTSAPEISVLRTDIEALKNNLANVPQSEQIETIKADVETLRNNLANVPQSAQIDSIKADVETLRNNLEKVPQSEQIDSIKADVETLRSNLEKVPQSEQIDSIKADVETLRNDLAKVPQAEELNTVKADVETLKADLTKVPQPAELSEVKNTVDTLKSDLAKVAQPVAPPPEIDEMQKTMKALKDEIDALRAEINKLKANGAQPPQA